MPPPPPPPPPQFHDKPKGSDGAEQARALLAVARGCGGPVGVLSREKPDVGLPTAWAALLAASGLAFPDVGPGLGLLLAPKDEAELALVRKAANLSAAVLERCLLPDLERAVDEGARPRHSALADRAMDASMDPAKEPVGVKLKAENVELCFPFTVQSGDYDLRWQAGCNDNQLGAPRGGAGVGGARQWR